MESRQRQQVTFTESQQKMRKLLGIGEQSAPAVQKVDLMKLTEEQLIERKLVGLPYLVERQPGDGTVHDSYRDDVPDQKHKVQQRRQDLPEKRVRLRQAIETQLKRKIAPLEPASETQWIGLDETTSRRVRIKFEENKTDGS